MDHDISGSCLKFVGVWSEVRLFRGDGVFIRQLFEPLAEVVQQHVIDKVVAGAGVGFDLSPAHDDSGGFPRLLQLGKIQGKERVVLQFFIATEGCDRDRVFVRVRPLLRHGGAV